MFSYRTSSTDYAPSSTLGMVVMAAQYNVLDPAFQSKLVMENYDTAISVKTSNSSIYGVECKSNSQAANQMYVRATPNPGSSDSRLYDLCNFNLATVSNPSTGIIGELWVSYEVELFNPNITYSQYGTSSVIYHGNTGTGTATAPFNGMVETYSNLDANVTFPTTSSFQLPVLTSGGILEITILVHTTGTATATDGFSTTIAGTNATSKAIYRNGAVSSIFCGISPSQMIRSFSQTFNVTGSAPSFVVTAAALPSGSSYLASELIIRQLPYDLK